MTGVLQLEWSGADQANASLRQDFIPFCKTHIDAGDEIAVEVRVRKRTKSREQEQKMHAMFRDIADQVEIYDRKMPAESWKRLLIDAFKHDTKADASLAAEWGRFGDIELIPALNHPGVVMVGEQTRMFGKRLASAFIEWLLAFGAEKDVLWTDPKWRAEMGLPPAPRRLKGPKS